MLEGRIGGQIYFISHMYKILETKINILNTNEQFTSAVSPIFFNRIFNALFVYKLKKLQILALISRRPKIKISYSKKISLRPTWSTQHVLR